MSPMRTDFTPKSETHWFYVDSQNEPAGPVSLEQLRQMVRKGTIRPDAFVLPEGGGKWIPFSTIPAAKKRSLTRPQQQQDPHSRVRVIFYLVFFPPGGLVLLWRSHRFRTFGRVTLSLLTLGTSLPVFLTLLFLVFYAATLPTASSPAAKQKASASQPSVAQREAEAATEDGIAYKLASLDAGYPLPKSDASVLEFDRLLSDIVGAEGTSKEDIANRTWAVKKRLSQDGAEVTALNLLKGVHKIMMDPQAMANAGNPTYQSLLSTLATLIVAEKQKER